MDLTIRKILAFIGFLISVLTSLVIFLMELPATETILYIVSIIGGVIIVLRAIETSIEKLLEELEQQVNNRL